MTPHVVIRSEKPNLPCVHYNIALEGMHVVDTREPEGEIFVSLDLLYPEDVLPGVEGLLKKMDELECLPRAYYQQKGGAVYLIIVFRLRPVPFAFLNNLYPTEGRAPAVDLEALAVGLSALKLEVVLTAEARFSPKTFSRVLTFFKTSGFINLRLVRLLGEARQVLWQTKITKMEGGKP